MSVTANQNAAFAGIRLILNVWIKFWKKIKEKMIFFSAEVHQWQPVRIKYSAKSKIKPF